MYIPASFQEQHPENLHQLMQAHPLGLLVTHGISGLLASPLPFLLYPDEGEFGVLRVHLARANPHWKDLAGLAECLVVFQGPQGYVTPSWYPGKLETHKVVPTWNYATVHAWGTPSVIDDAAWLRRQLNDLTDYHEKPRLQPWSVDDAPADFVAAQMKAIIGIEIPIRRIEGKYKLSQNRNQADRAGVLKGISDVNDPHRNTGLTDLMEGA
ncbi:MAG: FMN-binding negative transcriptional regulator [Betaproteobacteria bacterium]